MGLKIGDRVELDLTRLVAISRDELSNPYRQPDNTWYNKRRRSDLAVLKYWDSGHFTKADIDKGSVSGVVVDRNKYRYCHVFVTYASGAQGLMVYREKFWDLAADQEKCMCRKVEA